MARPQRLASFPVESETVRNPPFDVLEEARILALTSDEAIDPAEPELEDKVDPVVKAQVARGLEEGMGAMMIYAQRLSDDPFWPIGLCVAWLLGRDRPEGVRLYARHRLGIGVIPVVGWADARTSLLRGLATARSVQLASLLRVAGGFRFRRQSGSI